MSGHVTWGFAHLFGIPPPRLSESQASLGHDLRVACLLLPTVPTKDARTAVLVFLCLPQQETGYGIHWSQAVIKSIPGSQGEFTAGLCEGNKTTQGRFCVSEWAEKGRKGGILFLFSFWFNKHKHLGEQSKAELLLNVAWKGCGGGELAPCLHTKSAWALVLFLALAAR